GYPRDGAEPRRRTVDVDAVRRLATKRVHRKRSSVPLRRKRSAERAAVPGDRGTAHCHRLCRARPVRPSTKDQRVPMMRRRRAIAAITVTTVALLVGAACSTGHDRAAPDHLGGPAPAPPTATSPPPADCADPTASLRPQGSLPTPNQMPAGSYLRTIQERGHLVVGVDQNTLLLGSRDPVDGKIRGFEVDLARQVAKAIFGDESRVELKAVPGGASASLSLVTTQTVDLAIDAVTVKCERLQDVDFSTIYYNASQRVLVPTDSTATQLQDLGGKKVCATKGTTSLDFIRRYQSSPALVPCPLRPRSDSPVPP